MRNVARCGGGWAALVLLALALIACGQSGPPVPTEAAPTPAVQPTSPVTATVHASGPRATIAATATPGASATVLPSPVVDGGVPGLPAALYFLENGQIHRVAPEDLSRRQISAEVAARPEMAPIGAFDIANDGRLVYQVDDLGADRLVLAAPNGDAAMVLFEQPEVQIGTPRWSPDGSRIAVRLSLVPPDTTRFQNGVYLMTAQGGLPELLQADDPVDDAVNPSPAVRAYSPRAWAPDGSALLLEAFSPYYELCTPAIRELAAATPRLLTAPEGLVAACSDASWSSDSTAVYVRMAAADSQLAGAGLWRIERDGSQRELIARQREGIYQLIVGAVEPVAGRLFFFFAASETLPSAFSMEPGLAFVMQRTSVDGRNERAALRSDAVANPLEVLWAPDGSGAAVVEAQEGQPRLRWLPPGDAAALELPAQGFGVEQLHWGP